MKKQYCHKNIEKKIQNYWKKNKTFKVIEDKNKEKYYCLSMIPYPSGKLHMGHIRNYTIGDVISRYQRMLGKNVLQPIGWDAFGLPAENAAIKNNTTPEKWTYNNIRYMRKQLKTLGFSYDWDREITTCKPEYYRWEQWFFIKLYKKKLVYKKLSLVNWCPNDLTVLANEQVINGRCWNCDSIIELKKIPQWFIKITAYAEELLNDLDKLKNWPKQVKNMQRNWIGRTEGIEIDFNIVNTSKIITIYTTNLSTFMGATFIAITINHPIIKEIDINNHKIIQFIKECNEIKNKKLKETNIKGFYLNMDVIHPLTKNFLPIWIINFIPVESNDEANIAIPAHNNTYLNFAKEYNIPIKKVISIENILINSEEFTGLNPETASKSILKKLISIGAGKHKINYKLHDWCISRQRYWGTPIPIATMKDGNIITIPEEELPVIHTINNKLKNNNKYKNISIKNKFAFRETDTFDTFIESSWYYARYTCPKYNHGMIDPITAAYWLPVDQYIGGIEHAILHLLYFRLFHKLMRDLKLINSDEPVKNLLCQGMVLSDTFYYIKNNGQRIWVSNENISLKRDNKNNIINATDNKCHKLIYAGMCKMSKSKNNGIDPEKIIEKYGADTLRLFLMFAAPPESTIEWQESNIKGANRFIKKIWSLVYNFTQKKTTCILIKKSLTTEQKKIRYFLHKTIEKVTDDIERRHTFNTAIAAIMKFTNKLCNIPQETKEDLALIKESLEAIVLMLSPIIPHVCFEMWNFLGHKENIDFVNWPTVDKKAIKNNFQLIIIQINGKTRGCINVPNNSNENFIFNEAQKKSNISKYIKKGNIINTIYIPNKLLNFIINWFLLIIKNKCII
ncbi:leucine--tRNA ligase [Candidatus Providencia siddallii]|uniref:Leucine--tRNA ligase n=1 Tax=Candidatus Providencia siddallii TaxID=1715285 RepID=A0ABM9NNF1_9GAMM